ncbi:MAG TPA: galactokinase [Streptosporangiaceae bacterium]|nr:galactokinase [Streptosporangiaceae bacterium]
MTSGFGDPADGAAHRFASRFGDRPDGLWRAPGRVNLIGEHTDYNDGFALPFAIGASVCAAASRREDGLLVLTSCQESDEVTVPADSLSPGSVRGWAAYPAGVAWSLRSAGYRVAGASVAIDANLTLGAGLSSSAALECATALALADLYGVRVPRSDLAALARRAENDFVGAPTGIMDQVAVLTCAEGRALLLDCRTGTGTQIPFDPSAAGLTMLIIDTRARHELTDGAYAARRTACEEAARALGVPALRDITDLAQLGPLAGGESGDSTNNANNENNANIKDSGEDGDSGDSHDSHELLRRARHVVTENNRVVRTAELLRLGRIAEIGPLLTASHESLRSDFEVSWPQADTAVAAGLAAGALGARMTGGGFGGSVIALVPAGLTDAVTAKVREAFAASGWNEPAITATVPSASASRLR